MGRTPRLIVSRLSRSLRNALKDINKMLKRILFMLVITSIVPALAHAQAITAYNAAVSVQGSATVTASASLPIASFACNQPVPVGPTINPQRIIVNDPVVLGRACIWTDPGVANPATPGLLLSLPFGATAYTLTLSATNAAGVSGVSTPSLPFTIVGAVPNVPTGVSVIR